MAPLNEENDDEDDSTLFDVKYRFDLFVINTYLNATDIHDISTPNKVRFS